MVGILGCYRSIATLLSGAGRRTHRRSSGFSASAPEYGPTQGGSSVRPANFLPSATIDAFEASSLVAISLSEWDPSKD